MKHISQMESDKVSISDFPAVIPDEELAFLHDWQKKLYRNVMKDIHKALISLGCTIRGTLLQMNEVEEEQIQDLEDSDNSEHANNAKSDRTSSCYQDSNPDKLFVRKHEEHEDFMDHTITEQVAVISNTEPVITPVLPFNIKEESESVCLDHPDSMIRDIDSPTDASVVSFVLNGDEHQLFGDAVDPGKESCEYLDTGDGSAVRKRKVRKPMKLNDQSTPCKSTSPKVQMRMLQSFDRARAISHMQSENCQQLPEEQETLWQSSQITFSSSGKRSSAYVHEFVSYGQSESSKGFVKIMSHDLDTALTSKMYSSPEREKVPFEDESSIALLKTDAQKKEFICIECGEKFSELAKLLSHETIHMGESFYCTLCGRSFSEKGVFVRHQRVHISEKPFPCTVCGASFNEKAPLLRHHKIHTGEKPFQCSLCGKSYNRKDTLNRHLTIHARARTIDSNVNKT